MSGLYSHTTRSSGTTLTASIYNSDHQNHIDNHIPEQIDDYSVDVTEMRVTTDPGESGTESRPTSLAGEIERLRFIIAEITGKTQWYESPDTNIMTSGVSIDSDDNISGYGAKVEEKTADFTLSTSEKGKTIECNKATAFTVTVPSNTNVSLPVGYSVTFVQTGSGTLSFSGQSGVTINHAGGAAEARAQYSGCTLYKSATDTWILLGDIAQ